MDAFLHMEHVAEQRAIAGGGKWLWMSVRHSWSSSSQSIIVGGPDPGAMVPGLQSASGKIPRDGPRPAGYKFIGDGPRQAARSPEMETHSVKQEALMIVG